jgi:phosphoribosylanthranilate isomerase
MFHIKICGITNVDDALAAARAGADAVGLNFYPESPRFLTAEQARRIIDALPEDLIKVGLFVNAPAEEVCRTVDRLGLDLIQLHGDEPPYYLPDLGSRPVMRAFRLSPERMESPTFLDPNRGVGRESREQGPLDAMAGYLSCCRGLGCLPQLVLCDAHVKGTYGGTGEVTDWQTVRVYQSSRDEAVLPPLVLAGGLTPRNIAEAIHTVRPAAVDTASGVESSPGHKDPVAVEAFVRAARAAFESLGS